MRRLTHVVPLLAQRLALTINAVLQSPDRRESRRQHQQQHPRHGFLGIHFRLRLEKTTDAAVSTIVQ